MHSSKDQLSAFKHLFLQFLLLFQSAFLYGYANYCGDPKTRSHTVEIGEEVHLHVFINFRWPKLGTDLVLKKNVEGEIGRCSGTQFSETSLRNITCNTRLDKFRMETSDNCDRYCFLDVYITPTNEEDDSGVFFVELDRASCRYITANITAQETKPLCSV